MDEVTLTEAGWVWKIHNFTFFDISGSSKFIVNLNVQINVTHSIFIVNRFFLNARNNVLYQNQ